jgi:apolipoprotein N-acyltransferase
MLSRLRQPGGWIGGLSLTGFLVLGILGVFGVVMLVIALIADKEWWSDQNSEQVFGLGIFALITLGAVGFLIMDQQMWLGASLAVLGSLVFAVMIFWAILPVFLGLLFAVVAVLRARQLKGMPVQPPPADAPA